MSIELNKTIASPADLHKLIKLARKELPKSSSEVLALRKEIANTIKTTRRLIKNNDWLLRQNKLLNTKLIDCDSSILNRDLQIKDFINAIGAINLNYLTMPLCNTPIEIFSPAIENLQDLAEKISNSNNLK